MLVDKGMETVEAMEMALRSDDQEMVDALRDEGKADGSNINHHIKSQGRRTKRRRIRRRDSNKKRKSNRRRKSKSDKKRKRKRKKTRKYH